jgi:hypothetical protein
MARRTLDKGTRVIVATAAVVLGLVLGIVVVGVLNGRGQSGQQAYQPFFAGQSDRITRLIQSGGPVFYPDPHKGDRAFYLDVEGDRIVALHVVPPGGTAGCLVQWSRMERRYEDCHGVPVDRATLARFPVLTRPIGDKTSVFVDLRTITPAPAPGAGAATPSG